MPPEASHWEGQNSVMADCLHEATTRMTCLSVQSAQKCMLAWKACVMQLSKSHDLLDKRSRCNKGFFAVDVC